MVGRVHLPLPRAARLCRRGQSQRQGRQARAQGSGQQRHPHYINAVAQQRRIEFVGAIDQSVDGGVGAVGQVGKQNGEQFVLI